MKGNDQRMAKERRLMGLLQAHPTLSNQINAYMKARTRKQNRRRRNKTRRQH
jgi:hypothetical protein